MGTGAGMEAQSLEIDCMRFKFLETQKKERNGLNLGSLLREAGPQWQKGDKLLARKPPSKVSLLNDPSSDIPVKM